MGRAWERGACGERERRDGNGKILGRENLVCEICIPFFSLNFLLRFNFNDGTPSANFDTFPAAIMTVFQV